MGVKYFLKGSTVTFTVSEVGNVEFEGWYSNGELLSSNNPFITNVDMLPKGVDGIVNVKAHFLPIGSGGKKTYSIGAINNNPDKGHIEMKINDDPYRVTDYITGKEGDTVYVKAVPNEGKYFWGFNGGDVQSQSQNVKEMIVGQHHTPRITFGDTLPRTTRCLVIINNEQGRELVRGNVNLGTNAQVYAKDAFYYLKKYANRATITEGYATYYKDGVEYDITTPINEESITLVAKLTVTKTKVCLCDDNELPYQPVVGKIISGCGDYNVGSVATIKAANQNDSTFLGWYKLNRVPEGTPDSFRPPYLYIESPRGSYPIGYIDTNRPYTIPEWNDYYTLGDKLSDDLTYNYTVTDETVVIKAVFQDNRDTTPRITIKRIEGETESWWGTVDGYGDYIQSDDPSDTVTLVAHPNDGTVNAKMYFHCWAIKRENNEITYTGFNTPTITFDRSKNVEVSPRFYMKPLYRFTIDLGLTPNKCKTVKVNTKSSSIPIYKIDDYSYYLPSTCGFSINIEPNSGIEMLYDDTFGNATFYGTKTATFINGTIALNNQDYTLVIGFNDVETRHLSIINPTSTEYGISGEFEGNLELDIAKDSTQILHFIRNKGWEITKLIVDGVEHDITYNNLTNSATLVGNELIAIKMDINHTLGIKTEWRGLFKYDIEYSPSSNRGETIIDYNYNLEQSNAKVSCYPAHRFDLVGNKIMCTQYNRFVKMKLNNNDVTSTESKPYVFNLECIEFKKPINDKLTIELEQYSTPQIFEVTTTDLNKINWKTL